VLQAEDGIRDWSVTGVQTCALPILRMFRRPPKRYTTGNTPRRISVSTYADRLEVLAAEAADRCTGCGTCFEVCPTAREIGMDVRSEERRVGEEWGCWWGEGE